MEEGYTDPRLADELFSPASVRRRGTILVARDPESGDAAGMIVVVRPGAAGRQIATGPEAELHLLAVRPEWRGRGIARELVAAALAHARAEGHARIVLSTQETMTAAQSLYARSGFTRLPARDWRRGDRRFLAFGRDL